MTRATDLCMFCLEQSIDSPPEHILSEGLVGQQRFSVSTGAIVGSADVELVLGDGEVCLSCNNELGKLDAYLQQQVGFLKAYINKGVTKRGRKPFVDRPGLYAEHRPEGPYIVLNMERHPVTTPDGITVQPAQGHKMAVQGTPPIVDSNIVSLNIQQPTRMNKRYVRALHKIAFELLCFTKSRELALSEEFDSVREYVRYAKGNREMVVTTEARAGQWEDLQLNVAKEESWPGWLVTIRLGAVHRIDLSPGNTFFKRASQDELRAANMVRWSDKGHPV